MWNAAPITFPKTDGVTGYNDITPRGGCAYDLFGNGKTSLKVNVGKYLQSANNQENYTISNPALDGRNGRRGPNFQTTAPRERSSTSTATTIPTAICSTRRPTASASPRSGNFANPNALTIVNPDVLQRLGRASLRLAVGRVGAARDPAAHLARGRLRAALVQQLLRVRQHQHQAVDFERTTITAPTNAKLPDGGGYPVTYQFREPGANTGHPEQVHVRQRLRRLDELLAWRGHHRELASAQWADAPDRVEHRARRDRQLRGRRAGA